MACREAAAREAAGGLAPRLLTRFLLGTCTCSAAAAASKDRQLVVHGTTGGITPEAKAALNTTITVPTAAGGEVRRWVMRSGKHTGGRDGRCH